MSSHYTTSNISRLGRSSKYSSKSSTMRSEKLVFVENEAPKKEKIDPTTISKKELELKEFEEEQKKKKLKEQLEEKKYRNISVRISKEENILCLSVDGSQTSKDAFEKPHYTVFLLDQKGKETEKEKETELEDEDDTNENEINTSENQETDKEIIPKSESEITTPEVQNEEKNTDINILNKKKMYKTNIIKSNPDKIASEGCEFYFLLNYYLFPYLFLFLFLFLYFYLLDLLVL